MLYKNNFKFGITEFGDAAIDQSWADKMHAVIGAVISSKMVNSDFVEKLIQYQDKVIYHAIISGLGETGLEPGVPSSKDVLDQIEYLMNHGFKPNHVIIRIDPIMPYTWFDEINSLYKINYINNIQYILKRAKELEIQRIRYGFLRMTPQTLKRLYENNSHFVLPINWKYDPSNELSLHVLDDGFKYESDDLFNPYVNHVPIISNEELKILNLYNKYRFENDEDYIKNILQLLSYQSSCSGKCTVCDLGNVKKFTVFS